MDRRASTAAARYVIVKQTSYSRARTARRACYVRRMTIADEQSAAPVVAPPAERPQFAHPAEAEFAKILDFYQIRWEYEPHSFPLRWAADGRPIEFFAPDFYLPELDLYIELTTLKQSLVTKKNRKLRRLRELYPHVRVKLLYRRDLASLALKYRLRGVVEGM